MCAGSYGFSMASNYNSRPRPAEVLVRGERWAVVREREGHADLVKGELVPAFLWEPREEPHGCSGPKGEAELASRRRMRRAFGG